MKTHTAVLLLRRRGRKRNERLSFAGPLFSNPTEWILYCNCFFPIEHPTGLLHPFTTPNNPHPLHNHLQIFITRNYFAISPNHTNRNARRGSGTGVTAIRKVTVVVVGACGCVCAHGRLGGRVPSALCIRASIGTFSGRLCC